MITNLPDFFLEEDEKFNASNHIFLGIQESEELATNNLQNAEIITGKLKGIISLGRVNDEAISLSIEEINKSIEELKNMECQIMRYVEEQSSLESSIHKKLEDFYLPELQNKQTIIANKMSNIQTYSIRISEQYEKQRHNKIMNEKKEKSYKLMIHEQMSWKELKNYWKNRQIEYDQRYKQLLNLNEYIKDRFKSLNAEYNNLIENKNRVIVNKQNLEMLLEVSKKEIEEKLNGLIKESDLIADKIIKSNKTIENQEAELKMIKSSINESEHNLGILEKNRLAKENYLANVLLSIKEKDTILLKINEIYALEKLKTEKLAEYSKESELTIQEIKKLEVQLQNAKDNYENIKNREVEDLSNSESIIELHHVERANAELMEEINILEQSITSYETSIRMEAEKIIEKKDISSVKDTSSVIDTIKEAIEKKEKEMDKGLFGYFSSTNEKGISEQDIREYITKINSILIKDTMKGKVDNLKRNKAENMRNMEKLLVESLALLQKIDDEEAQNEQDFKNGPLQQIFTQYKLESSQSCNSNRRLLTPIKCQNMLMIYPNRKTTRCDDDILFGSDL
ncbi:hypothetical protein ACR3K2_11980 [Cryptosporidium serpentis]